MLCKEQRTATAASQQPDWHRPDILQCQTTIIVNLGINNSIHTTFCFSFCPLEKQKISNMYFMEKIKFFRSSMWRQHFMQSRSKKFFERRKICNSIVKNNLQKYSSQSNEAMLRPRRTCIILFHVSQDSNKFAERNNNKKINEDFQQHSRVAASHMYSKTRRNEGRKITAVTTD